MNYIVTECYRMSNISSLEEDSKNKIEENLIQYLKETGLFKLMYNISVMYNCILCIVLIAVDAEAPK